MNLGERQFDVSFGKRVRGARTARRWSQEYLAKQLAEYGLTIHQTQIAKIEAGARTAKLPEAVALARALAVPLETLVRPASPRPVRTRASRQFMAATMKDLEILRNQIGAVEHERKVTYQELSVTQDRRHVAEMSLKSAQEELQRERDHLRRLTENARRLESELAQLRELEYRYEEQMDRGDTNAPEEEDQG